MPTRRAKDILTTNRDKLELIAKSLLEYETLDGQQVEEIVRTGKFTPPPPTPQVEPPHGRAGRHAVPEAPTKPAPPKLPGLGHARAGYRLRTVRRPRHSPAWSRLWRGFPVRHFGSAL